MSDHDVPATRRETRLLFLTIGVSVLTLLLLARFRFPSTGPQPAEPASNAPLERLAARATYDELASIMDDLWGRVAPLIVVVAARGDRPGISFVPAVRVGDRRAVAVIGREDQVDSTTGTPARIIARAPAGDLAVLEIEAPAGAPVNRNEALEASGPRYVGIVEGGAPQAAVRPLYVGRTDLFEDPRGTGRLLRVAAAQQSLPHGAAVFALDGKFIGLVTEVGATPAIVPASTAMTFATAASDAPPGHGDLGLDVQGLTPPLARATGASSGVIVTRVRAPAASLLSGDVIQAIDGTAVSSVGSFREISESLAPGSRVTLDIVRRRTPASVEVTVGDGTSDEGPSSSPSDPGAILRTVARAGAEVVAVSPDSAAAHAGLQRGDLIVALDGAPSPDARAIARGYRALDNGSALLLTVQRAGDQRVVALEKR